MEPIAIIGMSCRLPGASSLEDFWSLLCDGRHGISVIPESRWDRERTFDSDPRKPGKINTRSGGFLEGVDLFDNGFFRITPEEARQMDPQQRIMLELAYEAFDDAGLSPVAVDGTDTAVFVGVMSNDYLRNQIADEYRQIDSYTGSGSGYCMIANRISYQFNLQGPSIAIDTACSSSLVSTFMACESLWTRQCSLALAGGVNLILSPTLSMFYTRSGLSAPDGKCRTFSSDASGMGRGEGAGAVVLKRLSDAISDGDRIYALIRGGAINHNGRGNGMSAPNRWAQQFLLRKAYKHAGVNPHDLQYVELHGTGTLIGDAIEGTALGSVLTEDQSPGHTCLIGSVKTNLGHLEGAAGVAGLIKLALCLHHGQLVPSLWYKAPNPHIAFDDLHLRVVDRRQDWLDAGEMRLAGISSFGLGGANAHLVLQSAPNISPATVSSLEMGLYVLQLSARSDAALVQMTGRYHDFIERLNDQQFSALCHTMLVRPLAHECRTTFIARNRKEMIHCLSDPMAAALSPNVFSGRYRELPKRKCVFIFPDFGTIDASAAQPFAKIHPCFKEILEECDRAVQEILPCRIGPLAATLCEHSNQVDPVSLPFVQFGLQVAFARLWRAAGFHPDAVAGIGMGQITSWLVSGSLDMKGAIARIAAINHLDLTETGLTCLNCSSGFSIDCYSPAGKNVMPEPFHLLAVKPAETHPVNAFPDMPLWKEVDYFLLGLNVTETLPTGSDAPVSLVTANTPQAFWRELARLSVWYNVEWKTFLAPLPLMRRPRYPWQHSRFWLENSHPHEIPSGHVQADANGIPDTNGNASSPHDEHPLAIENGIAGGDQTDSTFSREDLLMLPESQRKSAITAYLKEQIAGTLRLSAEQLEEPQTFTGLGLDSLTALQLKNRVETDLKVPVSLVKLLDGHSIGDLATDLITNGTPSGTDASNHTPQHPAKISPSQSKINDVLTADLAEISPQDVDEMLRQLLSTESTPEFSPSF